MGRLGMVVGLVCGLAVLGAAGAALAAEVSGDTGDCIGCHEEVTPGIVEDWRTSRHSRVSPAEGLAKPKLQRRVSAPAVPEGLATTAVGCAECHTRNADKHPDTFEHNGFSVHVV
ncbi:MAG TPA: hypothetical protein VK997_02940, partial [Deferrisomatales bacterium]|nr:hypothetical protein [Deferrisomatales bacterium]